MLGGKANDGGGAAECGRCGGALEGVGIDDAGGRELLDVGVGIDAARQHQAIRGIDLGGTGRQIAADCRDHAVLDTDIGVELVDRGANSARRE